MKRVKFFMDTNTNNLEDMINDFMSREEIEIIDIYFSTHSSPNNQRGGCGVMLTYRKYGIEERQRDSHGSHGSHGF